jgi:hypothetical protein
MLLSSQPRHHVVPSSPKLHESLKSSKSVESIGGHSRQCIEHYGAGETYMPVLEALGQLCRGRDGQVFVDVLTRQAPTWLLQLPTVDLQEARGLLADLDS